MVAGRASGVAASVCGEREPAPGTGGSDGHAVGRGAVLTLPALTPALVSCSGIQSALDPAGEEARQVAKLFWIMTASGAVIWALVILLALYASRWKRKQISPQAAGKLILWAGAVFPVGVLAAL